MNCHDCQNLLSDLVHGELLDEQRPAVEAHLAECEACRAAEAGLRETVALLDALEPIEDPSDVAAIVAAAGADAPARPGRGRGALVGAAAAVLLFLGLLAVSAEVRYDSGRLSIAFGRPAVIESPATFADYEPYVQETAREEFSLQGAGLVERVVDALRSLDEAHAQREEVLIAAFEALRHEDLQRIEQRFLALDEDAQHQRAALEQVATLVSRIETPSRP
jgi:hypothetical protein